MTLSLLPQLAAATNRSTGSKRGARAAESTAKTAPETASRAVKRRLLLRRDLGAPAVSEGLPVEDRHPDRLVAGDRARWHVPAHRPWRHRRQGSVRLLGPDRRKYKVGGVETVEIRAGGDAIQFPPVTSEMQIKEEITSATSTLDDAIEGLEDRTGRSASPRRWR